MVFNRGESLGEINVHLGFYSYCHFIANFIITFLSILFLFFILSYFCLDAVIIEALWSADVVNVLFK